MSTLLGRTTLPPKLNSDSDWRQLSDWLAARGLYAVISVNGKVDIYRKQP